MAKSSLLTTTEQTRKYLLYFGIFIVVVILLQICMNIIGGLGGGNNSSESDDFTAYKQADETFGKLTLPAIPSLPISKNSNPSFEVDSDFVELPYEAVNVYQIEQPRERFVTQTKAKSIAAKIGFEREPRIEDSLLTWRGNDATLTYDKITQQISFTNPFARPTGGPGVFSNDLIVTQNDAVDLVSDIGLNRPGLNLEPASVEINYLNREGQTFTEATSPTTASYVRINVYRTLELASLKIDDNGNIPDNILDEYDPISARVVTENYQAAPMEIIVAGSEDGLLVENMYSLNFTDWNILNEPGVYKVLSPDEAWENVKQGKGSLQEITEFGFDRFETGREANKDVLSFTAQYLQTEVAYLEPDEWTGYFYPIYIFKGRARLANSPNQDNADFIFYTYAINPE